MASLFKIRKPIRPLQLGINIGLAAIGLTAFCFSENKSSNLVQKACLAACGATGFNLGRNLHSGNRHQVIMNGIGGVLTLAGAIFLEAKKQT